MIATEQITGPKPPRTFNAKDALAAIERGELMRLLAKIDTGEVTADELADVLDQHTRRHPLRSLLMLCLGRF